MSLSKTRLRHTIEGRELPQDEPLRCTKCSTRLSEGHPVTAAVERTDGSWMAMHLWCVRCAPTSCEDVVEPAIVEGDVAMVADTTNQRHYPVLILVEVADVRHEVPA